MPNAAASFDEDFGYDEQARRKAPRKPRAAQGRKKKRGGWSFDMGRVARYAAIGMSATIALGIMYNALMSQKGHHPAPLFGKPAPVVQARLPAQTRQPVDERPDASLAARASAMPEPADEAPEAPPPIAKARHGVASQHATDHGDDAIARLLQTGAAVPATGDRSDTKTVLAAQKALAKLGFAVKANGAMGPSTRKAIERFEQDRHLAVKGELTRRLVKTLSAESGVKID